MVYSNKDKRGSLISKDFGASDCFRHVTPRRESCTSDRGSAVSPEASTIQANSTTHSLMVLEGVPNGTRGSGKPIEVMRRLFGALITCK